MSKADIRKYESVVAIHPESTKETLQNFFQQLKKVLVSFEGSIHRVDSLGSKLLANLGTIKNVKSATYFHLYFEALPSGLKEVERLYKINDFVLYFHTEKLDSRMTLDQHQEQFEQILQDSKEREEQRQAYINTKLKKRRVAPTTSTEVSSQ